jgi:hypothetical protein
MYTLVCKLGPAGVNSKLHDCNIWAVVDWIVAGGKEEKPAD